MTATPEMLVAFMVVLLVIALGLILYVIRGIRKSRPTAAPTAGAAEDGTADSLSDVDVSFTPDFVTSVTDGESPLSSVEGHVADESPAAVGEDVPEPGAIQLMEVWQDSEGYLVIEVEGQRYRRLFEIRDGAVGRHVLDTVNRLVAFAKGQESRVSSSAPPVTPEAAPADVPSPADASTPTETTADKETQIFLEGMQQQDETRPQKSRVTVDPVPFRSTGAQRDITLNLADEIEQLLQIRLRASSEFSQRYIHVGNAPDGGLRFEVDGARYDALDEIPDLDVQALIRAAISDWEARR
jgi:hypothetical protein